MHVVAGKDLTIGGKERAIGEPVPEAATWPNRQAYLDGGFLVEVEDTPKREKADIKADAKVDYSSLLKAELVELADKADLAITTRTTKAKIIELLTE